MFFPPMLMVDVNKHVFRKQRTMLDNM
jgi:hypothetical protein